METRRTRAGLAAWSALVIAFLWVPLVIMAIYLVIARRLGAFEAM